MRWVAVSLVFVVGCRFDLPEVGPDDSGGGGSDAEPARRSTRGGHVRDVCAMGICPQAGSASNFSGGGGGGGGAGYIIVWAPSYPMSSPGIRTPPEVHLPNAEP